MGSVAMTTAERRLLLNLVRSKRAQYGPLKVQFDKHIISYIRALNRIEAKLEKELMR